MESLSYGNLNKISKTRQHREKRSENWTMEMRQILRNLVQQHSSIIESKSNSTHAIEAKKRAWQEISEAMTCWGYNIRPKRLKEAWGRIKVYSKTAEPQGVEAVTQTATCSDMKTTESVLEPTDYMELTIKEEPCKQEKFEVQEKIFSKNDIKNFHTLESKVPQYTLSEQHSKDQERFIAQKIAAIEEERTNLQAIRQLQIEYEQKRIYFLEREYAAKTELLKEKTETQKLMQMYLKKKIVDSKVYGTNKRRLSS